MKTLIIAGVVAVGLFAAAPASADPGQFLNELRHNGVPVADGNESEALNLGFGVCVDLFNGWTVGETLNKLVQDLGATTDQAYTIVGAAIDNICPTAGQDPRDGLQQPHKPITGGVGGPVR